jgi:hypothetical protein
MTTPSPSEGGESFPSFGGAGVVKNKLRSPKNSTDILLFFVFFLLFRVKKVKTKYLFTRLDVLHFAIDLLQRPPHLGVQRE